MDEIENIKERYDRRKKDERRTTKVSSYYDQAVCEEREVLIKGLLRGMNDNIRMLDIGAGTGGNMQLFRSIGFRDDQIVLNELLEDRLAILRDNFPAVKLIPGNALDIQEPDGFDLIFQFTVFTSILDDSFRKKLAEKMWMLLKPGGRIIWYDFVYNNPANKDVRGVPVKEIRALFCMAEIKTYPVTLAPPIGRRTGKLYRLLNTLFPFLRTHVVAEIKKPQ